MTDNFDFLVPPGSTLLVSPEQIKQRVEQMADEVCTVMAKDQQKPWVVLGVLRGAFVFMADLVRSFNLPVEIDFIQLSSYGDQIRSSGNIEVVNIPTINLENRSVLLVDDVLDTGNSMLWLVNYLNSLKVAKVLTCVLLDKPDCRKLAIGANFVGFSLPPAYIVGYGLDKAQQYRQLPGIYQLPEEKA